MKTYLTSITGPDGHEYCHEIKAENAAEALETITRKMNPAAHSPRVIREVVPEPSIFDIMEIREAIEKVRSFIPDLFEFGLLTTEGVLFVGVETNPQVQKLIQETDFPVRYGRADLRWPGDPRGVHLVIGDGDGNCYSRQELSTL